MISHLRRSDHNSTNDDQRVLDFTKSSSQGAAETTKSSTSHLALHIRQVPVSILMELKMELIHKSPDKKKKLIFINSCILTDLALRLERNFITIFFLHLLKCP